MSNEKQEEKKKDFTEMLRQFKLKQRAEWQRESDMKLIKWLVEYCERDKELSKGSSLEAKNGNFHTPACSEFSPKILGTKATTLIIDDPINRNNFMSEPLSPDIEVKG